MKKNMQDCCNAMNQIIKENKEDSLNEDMSKEIRQMVAKVKNFNQFINENQTYIRNGYKYTNILRDGDFDYELVQSLNNKTVGIEVYFRRKIIGSIGIGLLDDDWLNDYQDNEYYQLIGKNPFIHNVTIIDEFQNRGISTKLYTLLFDSLKKDGYKKVYSGKTRNSIFVDNIWNKFSDGFEKINGDFGTKKIYYKNL